MPKFGKFDKFFGIDRPTPNAAKSALERAAVSAPRYAVGYSERSASSDEFRIWDGTRWQYVASREFLMMAQDGQMRITNGNGTFAVQVPWDAIIMTRGLRRMPLNMTLPTAYDYAQPAKTPTQLQREREAMAIEEMRATLEQAKVKLLEQQEFIDRVVNPSLGLATFVKFNSDDMDGDRFKSCMVSGGGGVVQVLVPGGALYDKFVQEATNGAQILVNTKTAQIVRLVKEPIANGAVVVISRIAAPYAEIGDGTSGGGTRAVYLGKVSVEVGDRVLLDQAGLVVLHNLGRPPQTDYLLDAVTNVSWDDVGGAAEAKLAMREAIEFPHLHADIYKYYNKSRVPATLRRPPDAVPPRLAGPPLFLPL